MTRSSIFFGLFFAFVIAELIGQSARGILGH